MISRRKLLLASLSAPIVSYSSVFAQSIATSLFRAPKHALVIGNGNYRQAPLKNPVNDANAIAALLKELGFGVATGLDLTQAGLRDAIRQFGDTLGKNKSIGLFYFAGHGAQLAWRNYLIPVDAEIADIGELRERGTDLNSLLESIRAAGNPMNMIILDACRDNPFGSTARLDQKGLSQLDAPPGTLLAYATSPGNVAADGEGNNGLYTENLLREMKVPEAKVEDVFKRVRLNVRRSSKGAQIPWESTSLEEDFWFIPPREIRKLAEADAAKQFEEELAIWEKIKASSESAPFVAYLEKYPSGRFSELAQFQLDRVFAKLGENKIEVVSAPDNPYSKGTAVANTNRKEGDSYTYRVNDLFTGLEKERYTEVIKHITDTQVIYDSGRITDLLGNNLRTREGRTSTGAQVWGVDYYVGKRWVSRAKITNANGIVTSNEIEMRVVARERFTSPAGDFNAFVVEGNGWGRGSTGSNVQFQNKRWIAPDRVRAELVFQTLRRVNGKIVASEREELIAYKQT